MLVPSWAASASASVPTADHPTLISVPASASPVTHKAQRPRAQLQVRSQVLAAGKIRIWAETNAKVVRVKYRTANGRNRTKSRRARKGTTLAVLPAGATSIKVMARPTKELRASRWIHSTPVPRRSPRLTDTPTTPGDPVASPSRPGVPKGVENPPGQGKRPVSGAYRVDGNRIVDPQGRVFVPHGLARPSLEWSCSGESLDGMPGIPTAEFERMRDAWAANTVRIGLNEAHWMGSVGLRGNNNPCPDYVSTVDDTVKRARNAGLVVILDLHWSTVDDSSPARQRCAPGPNTASFWESVARRFSADSGVWFELYNEPHDISWEVWRDGGHVACTDGSAYRATGMQQLVDVIRSAGATNIVLAGGGDWAYDLSGVPVWHLEGTNIAYATHPYAFKATAKDWDRAFGNVAAYAPIVATEFGRTTCADTDPYDADLLDYLRTHGVGYTAWAWWAGDCGFPSLLADPQATCVRGGCAVQADLTNLASGQRSMEFLATTSLPELGPLTLRNGFESGSGGWESVWGDCLAVSGTSAGGYASERRLSLEQRGPGYCAVGSTVDVQEPLGGAQLEMRVLLPSDAPATTIDPFVMDARWVVHMLGTVTLLPGWNWVRATVPDDVTGVNLLGLQTNSPSWVGELGLDQVAW